ncbi:MAG TPA: TAXI family TRAP transporter solute-binding subunit [Solirubrobacter sp.]|nr:TAXI family TRAP transporter solute-binding subunit [Solirubrobacter sp.]
MTVDWLAGNPGDGWYELTAAWVEVLNGGDGPRFAFAAGGGEENLTAVAAGRGDLGMSIDVVAAAAFNGGPPFTEPLRNLRCLGTGWSPLPYNLLAAADTPLDLATAVRGGTIRIGAPPEDTTDELMFQRVLAYYGVTAADIDAAGGRVLLADYHELVDALEAREIDAVFGATTLPAPSIERAATAARALALASLPADVVEHLRRRCGCRPGVIPAGSYPALQDGDVHTCFADTVIVVAAEADDELVHAVTGRLLDTVGRADAIHPSLAAFNPDTAWRNVPVPVHPAAARAYRERGHLG